MPTDTTLTPLARRLKKLRIAKGLSLRALADTIGIKHTSVYQWESGRSSPHSSHLGALAGALDVSVDDLLGIKAS